MRLGALILAGALFATASPAPAQVRDTAAAVRQLRQEVESGRLSPEEIRARIRAAGLSEDEVRRRLREAGYSPTLLDRYLSGAGEVGTELPEAELGGVLSGLRIPEVVPTAEEATAEAAAGAEERAGRAYRHNSCRLVGTGTGAECQRQH